MSIFLYPIYNNMSSFKQLINATPSQSPSNSSVRSSIPNGTPPPFFFILPHPPDSTGLNFLLVFR